MEEQISVRNKAGNTVAHNAARAGHAHLLDVLAQNGANLNIRGQAGMLPLHFAALFGRMACIEYVANPRKPKWA